MSVFIPQEWEETDLLNYLADGAVDMRHKRLVNLGMPTNDSDGLNRRYAEEHYVTKTSQGHINAKRKRITRVANPEDDGDAVSLRYFNQNKTKPMICVTAEAKGALAEDSYPFSFGGGGPTSGFVMPSAGTLKYITARSVNATAAHPLPIWVTVAINQVTQGNTEPRVIGSVLTPLNLAVATGDTLTFHNRWPSPQNEIAVVSMFIELEWV